MEESEIILLPRERRVPILSNNINTITNTHKYRSELTANHKTITINDIKIL